MELSDKEIEYVIRGFTSGRIPEYQISALAMAIFFRSMTAHETAKLTYEMLHSGSILQWPESCAPCADKHSTGGIGDKISLILAPMLACCGLCVPMISGRGLGATGGTLDKLESIPGYRCDLSLDEIQPIALRVGAVITGATQDLAPADRRLYALRDVTGTVPSIPLITSSILCKKLAEGIDALVLDVKFGSGAFMKDLDSARALARSLVDVATELGVKTTALITDMNQPIGRMVGHSVEVNESLDVLRGNVAGPLLDLSLALGGPLLMRCQMADDRRSAIAALRRTISTGAAYDKFREMVHAQGGDLDAPRPLARRYSHVARSSGYVQKIHAEILGQIVIQLGGGRQVMTDGIDHSVGLQMKVRVGDQIEAGQPLVELYGHNAISSEMSRLADTAFTIGSQSPGSLDLIIETVE